MKEVLDGAIINLKIGYILLSKENGLGDYHLLI